MTKRDYEILVTIIKNLMNLLELEVNNPNLIVKSL